MATMVPLQRERLKMLPLLFLYLIGFAMVTIVEFLSINQSAASGEIVLSFSTAAFKKNLPGLIICYSALGLYTAATLMMEINKFKKENKDYNLLNDKIADFARNNYVPLVFNKYCAIENRKRKIHAYKNLIIKKYNWLERFQTAKNYNAWVEFQKELAKPENAGKRIVPKNKYCQKRQRLEELLSEDYIEENVDKRRVRYNKLSASLILGGKLSNSFDDYNDEYVTRMKALIVVIDRAPHYLIMLAVLSTVTSIAVEAFELHLHWTAILMFILRIFVKIFSMLNTIISTIKYAEKYNDTITLKDIRFRWGVCHEFNNWAQQQLKAATKPQPVAPIEVKAPEPVQSQRAPEPLTEPQTIKETDNGETEGREPINQTE